MKAIRLKYILLSLCLCISVHTAEATANPVKIFLLSGQSNMTGLGSLGELTKPAAEQQATLNRYIMDPANVENFNFLYSGSNKTATG
jgi:hypothetical protein